MGRIAALAPRTHSYRRRGDVPAVLRSTQKVCAHCDKWFAARSRETVCDACVPPKVRAKRAAQGNDTRTAPSVAKRAGQSRVKSEVQSGFQTIYSEYLNLTFRCLLSDPRAASLEGRVLAYEEAARQRWKFGRTP